MLHRAREQAAELDARDPAFGTPAVPVRLSDHATLGGEETGAIPFAQLLAAEFHPASPRDRIEHSWLAPADLDAAAESLTSALPVPVGRHNRYRPVPGEDGLRTDDLLDFVRWYGHEYQVLVFRAVDVRTASVLDIEQLTRAGRDAGASVIVDWTGADDWLDAGPPAAASAVFWATHRSLRDGRAIEAGWYRPGERPPRDTPVASVDARAGRLAAFAASVFESAVFDGAGAGSDTVVRHPQQNTDLPLLVLDAGAESTGIADALTAGPGFRSVVRYGDRIVALPDSDASYSAIVDRAAAMPAAVRS